MKKYLKFAICFTAVMIFTVVLCVSVSAFNVSDNVERFSDIDEYNGKLYCSYEESMIGGVNEYVCNMLPYGMHNIGWIASFTIRDGYIYYLTTEIGSAPIKGEIYRCNLDGTNNVYIADNAVASTECFIVNDVLYYSKGTPTGEDWYYKNDGIAKVDLETGEYRVIYDDDAYITHCDENYVYFYSYDYFYNPVYYRISNDGKNVARMAENDMEVSEGVIHYGKRYDAYDGGIYEYDWSGKSKWFANDARGIEKANGDIIYPEPYIWRSSVEAVIDGYVYYREYFNDTGSRYDLKHSSFISNPNTYLIRTNGLTNNQIVAWKFTS